MEPEISLPHSQVQTPTLHFLKIHLNIILPSKPESPQWSLSPRFPHQNPVHASPLPRTRYMPRLSRSSKFYHPRIIVGEEYRTLSSSSYTFLYSPVTLSLLRPNILLNTLFSNTLSLRSSLNVSDQVSHPHKTTGKVTVLYILTFNIFDFKVLQLAVCLLDVAAVQNISCWQRDCLWQIAASKCEGFVTFRQLTAAATWGCVGGGLVAPYHAHTFGSAISCTHIW